MNIIISEFSINCAKKYNNVSDNILLFITLYFDLIVMCDFEQFMYGFIT